VAQAYLERGNLQGAFFGSSEVVSLLRDCRIGAGI